MATQVRFRRDTRANLDLSTPVEGEIGVDTTNNRLILGDGSTSGGIPQASYVDVQNQRFTAADGSGTNTITLSFDDAPTAYAEYQRFTFKPSENNTGATTLNVNSLGAKNIKKDDGSGTLVDLEGDELKANIPVDVIYDGTQFVVQLGGGSSGVYQLLSETDASSTSSIDFTSSTITGYRRYEVHFSDVKPSTSGASLGVRISTDGGSSYVSASAYNHYGRQYTGTGTTPTGGDIGRTETLFSVDGGLGVRTGSANGLDGKIVITNPLSTTSHKHAFFEGNFVETGNNFAIVSGGVWMSSTYNTVDIDGLQILFDSGNIASGNIKLYGVT